MKNQEKWMERKLTLHNNIEEIPQLAPFVEDVAEAAGMDMSTAMSMNLALEEAVVNVMEYAYPKGTVGLVEITVRYNDEQLDFILIDSGTPFDPTTRKEVDVTKDIEDRPIGGLGIHLIREIMDDLTYRYKDGKNILTLTKKIVKE